METAAVIIGFVAGLFVVLVFPSLVTKTSLALVGVVAVLTLAAGLGLTKTTAGVRNGPSQDPIRAAADAIHGSGLTASRKLILRVGLMLSYAAMALFGALFAYPALIILVRT